MDFISRVSTTKIARNAKQYSSNVKSLHVVIWISYTLNMNALSFVKQIRIYRLYLGVNKFSLGNDIKLNIALPISNCMVYDVAFHTYTKRKEQQMLFAGKN